MRIARTISTTPEGPPHCRRVFESQGLAVSDVAAAAYVYGKAKEQGLGVELPMSS